MVLFYSKMIKNISVINKQRIVDYIFKIIFKQEKMFVTIFTVDTIVAIKGWLNALVKLRKY